MRKFDKLRDSKEFSRLYKEARRWHCEAGVIFYQKSDECKIAFIASKKVGKAVARNRAKRLLRAVFFTMQTRLKEGKYILVAKQELLSLSFLKLKKNLEWGFKSLECLK